MELIDYLNIVSKRKALIVTLIILIVVGGILFSVLIPEAYLTSVSLAVSREGRQDTQDYKYDGYYSLQASELFSETVVSWFLSPEVVTDIFEKAEIDPETENLRELSHIFDAEKLAAQNVLVKFKTSNKDDAEKLSRAMQEVVTERTKILNSASGEDAKFTVIVKDPITVSGSPEMWLIAIISLVVGVVMSIGIAFLVDYIGRSKIPRA